MRPTLRKLCLFAALALSYGATLIAGCRPSFYLTGCTSCHERQDEAPPPRRSCGTCHEENERCKDMVQAIGGLPEEDACGRCHDMELTALVSHAATPAGGSGAPPGKQQLPFAPVSAHNTGHGAAGCTPCHDGSISPSTGKD